jgi:transaldolase
MKPVESLHRLGQSIWYDNIERRILKNGDLKEMIDAGIIRGVTSNPSIFNNAISKSNDYYGDIKTLAGASKNKEEIYEALAVSDIQEACDLFRPLYEQSEGGDGYVSLEVNPYYAKDTKSTIVDAKRLWEMVDRQNLMVKIPGTEEGLATITEAISAGININVTLIFSNVRYEQVIDAYLLGLESRVQQGYPIDKIASVASFFVSRIDTNVDDRIQDLFESGQISETQAKGIQGKIAVANAKLAFALHKKIFQGERFLSLQENGARVQRALWASTSTKNPQYPDTKYVDELIGPDTVNTMPPQTLHAFQDHGKVGLTLEENISGVKEEMEALAELGVSIDDVTQELEVQGVKSFADAFTALLNSIEERRTASV